MENRVKRSGKPEPTGDIAPAFAGVTGHEFMRRRGEGRAGPEATAALNNSQLGLWALMGTLSMLFAGFTSAYLVRRASSDWRPISLPGILWFNTALLLSSSFTIEASRSAMRRWQREAFQYWLLATASLGVAFLVGQLFAWRHLAAQGVYLPTNPSSSFFYMLTAVHGAHLLGGLGGILYTLSRAWRSGSTFGGLSNLNLCATYWHFVDGLWLYLFILMSVW